MTALSPTASNVKRVSGPVKLGYAGAAIAPLQPVYKEAATGLFKLTDVDSATEEVRRCDGVALNTAAIGHPVVILFEDGSLVDTGAILTKGMRYYAGRTAGQLIPDADLQSGDAVVQVGVALSTSQLKLSLNNSGAII